MFPLLLDMPSLGITHFLRRSSFLQHLNWQTSVLTLPVSIGLSDLFIGIDGWGALYFSVNSSGDTIVGEIKASDLISNLSDGEVCTSPMLKKSKQKILLAI
ncbi:hypothetical protein HAX54_044839 [Datura stramonium]|uniref:Uncharacterized protein n=1 Tax=Datura stramonium TaxID=4076 RepID=A0ABS8SQ09_DATST|nr:hypothetical protein [Datura stramonium]